MPAFPHLAPYKGLTIRLDAGDSPARLHTNGDRVSGHVLFDPLNQYDMIVVHLKGAIFTEVTTGSGESSSTHYGLAILFDLSTTVHHGSMLIQSQSWPFEFEFPWQALPTVQEKPITPHEKFLDSPGHQLPPSFESHSGARTQRVSYFIEVVANNPSAFFHTSVKCCLPINFSPLRINLHPPSEPFNRSHTLARTSRKLDSAEAAHHLTLGERTRRFFHGPESSEPTAKFLVQYSIPTQVYAGGPIPITLGVQHDLAQSTAPQTPPVYLVNFHARLTSTTNVRVPYAALFGGGGSYTHRYRGKIPLVNPRPLREQMYDNMQLNEIFGGLRIPDALTPTFLSYTLGMQYVLKVTAVVQCAEKNYEIEMSNEPLLVLPYPCESTSRQAQGEPDPAKVIPEYQDPEVVDEELPRYQQYESKPRNTVETVGVTLHHGYDLAQ